MKLRPIMLIALSSFFLCAQAPSFSGAVETALSDLEKGAYIKAHDALAAAAFAPDGTVQDHVAFQLWAQFSPLLTNELELDAMARAGRPAKRDPTWVSRIAAAEPRDAIQEIVAQARNTNIVILNEAHSSPRDRAFALRVARALRPLGYKTLAVEAIDNNVPETGVSEADKLKHEGVVRLSTGVYTRDPVFARFLTEAVSIGYEPVAYEQTKAQDPPNSGIPEREQAQAENLMRNIFSARPKEKVLIFVGWGHVAEKPAKHGEMMAARLKGMTGIDPLTIDQTSVTDTGVATGEAYAAASARIGKDPVVFFEGSNPLLIGSITGVDLQVVHPRRSYVSGRPSWLVGLGGKQIPIPGHLLPRTGRRLIQAFAVDAPSDAVPLDQVLLTGSAAETVMVVPTEKVRFAVQQ